MGAGIGGDHDDGGNYNAYTGPRVGEWWYVKHPAPGYCAVFSEIEAVGPTEIVIRYDGHQIHCPIRNVISKWEPNWFCKLLGYK